MITNGYAEGGRLYAVDVDGTSFVDAITHDARGQRTSIELGNGVSTAYTYQADTFRLSTLVTTRASDGRKLQGLKIVPGEKRRLAGTVRALPPWMSSSSQEHTRSLPWRRLDKQWLSKDEVCRLQLLETAAHVYEARHLYGIGMPVVPDHLCGGYLLEADGTGFVGSCKTFLSIDTFGVSTDGTRESLLYDRRGYVPDRSESFVFRRDW